MTNWKKHKLKDLCTKIGSGSTPRGGDAAYKTHGISLIRSQNVLDFTFSKKGLAFIDDKQALELKNVTLQEQDVLLNITGDSVARVCQVPKNILPARVNQHVAIIRADKEKLNPEYLKYSLLSKPNKELLLTLASTGATRNAITKVMIENFEIEIPEEKNLTTQTRIASILSALDDKIELNRQTNQTLEQIAQTLFKKYFVDDIDPDNLPEGWRWGVFSEIVDFSNGCAFSSKDLLKENNGNCFHVFKMGHIKKGGGLNSEGTRSYFDKAKAKKLEKFILKKGDLLMCMTDMKDNMALLGHTALMNESDKYIVNQRVGLIRPSNEFNIGYPYLYILTNSSSFIEDLRNRANSGVQVNLSTNEIKNSKVVIPEKSINKEFNDLVFPIYERIFSMTSEIQKLSQIRDSLLPKLMSGEISVN